MCEDIEGQPDYEALAREDPEAFRLLTEFWAADSEWRMELLRVLNKNNVRFEFNTGVPREENRHPLQKKRDEAYARLIDYSCKKLMKAFELCSPPKPSSANTRSACRTTSSTSPR